VITEDIPPGALGVGRARQRNIPGWVRLRRPKTASAEAAAAALAGEAGERAAGEGTGEAEPGGGRPGTDGVGSGRPDGTASE
jgi:bifunctional UDP-N-acetylglucosamine pyrophosphorylase/glucosamine-1-phosphate N-acetyltransferase